MAQHVFVDDNRALLRVGGAEASEFLQGLISNDMGKVSPERLIYAALLTPQGKYLFDFFVGEDADGLFIDVTADRAPALAQRLMMYKLRRDVTITGEAVPVALMWGGGPAPEGALADPRNEALGWRCYHNAPAANASRTDYDELRVETVTPSTGVELIADQSYILEMGFERLHGVDFRKGCYVGQEVTARMKHKTELKKGLAQISVDGVAQPGDQILAGGKVAGTVHTVSGNTGLAYLRFDRATGEMHSGDQPDAATIRRQPN
ncbi:MAG: YgfZ/GcvT domain-containing protein [Pikeienuella sp.]